MRAGACTRLIIGLLFLTGVLDDGMLCAQTPRPNFDWELERVGVPEDTPHLWPWGDEQWEAIPRDEFEKLWAQRHASRQSPKSVWVESLHAEAVLTDETLRAGRLTAQIRSSNSQISLLPLEPLNVALTELTWSTGPAIWGCDASGRCWLAVPPGNHQLNGRWTAKGHKLTAGVEFELQWPQSAITSLELLAPPTYVLEVSTGEIIRQPNSETDFARWRIELGTALGTQIRARTTSPQASTPNLALASQEFSGLVREEEIRFQSLTNVELLGKPRSELVFLVGGEIEIFSVSLGADATLPHLLEPGPGRRRRLVISLPEPMLGRLRPIRIDGLASRRPGTPASAPSLFLENAVFQGTRYTLTIPGPLQMRSLRADGFRQIGAPLLTPAGEAWTFEQSIPEGRLIFDVRRPESSPSMQSLTQVVAGNEIWTMTAQLRWTVPSGSIFQLTCRIPPSWEVTDVRTLANAQSVEIAAWELQPQPEGDVQLAVELVRAVTPDRPGVIEILANRRVPRPGVALEPPIFQPLDCETVEQILLIDSSADWVPRFNNASGFEEIPQATLENTLNKAFRRPPLTNGNRLIFRATEITSPSTWRMVPRENPAEISARFDLLIEEDRLTERWEVTAKPLRGPLENLVISLKRADEFAWTLKDTANTRSIPVQIQPLNDPLTEATATEFRLSWPTGLEGSFTLEGTREQARTGVLEIPLLFCKTAERFEGLATVHAATPPNVALQGLGATPLSEEGSRGTSATTTDPWSRSWSYRGADAWLELRQPDNSSNSENPLILAVELRSLISANAIGQDLHRARFQIANAAEAGVFRFKLDSSIATLLSATVNGQRVAPTPFEASWIVPGLTGTGNDLVEILYRTVHPNSLLGDRRKIILPVPEGQVVHFEWNFAISPMAHLFQAPTGVRVREVLPPTPWTTRLFGPLARGSGSVFIPFFPETWSDLVYRPRPASTPLGDLDTNLIAPVEWQEYHAVAPTLPAEITLTTWHIYRLQLFEWCILLFCLLGVLVLRLLRWPARRTGIAACLAICLPASLFGDQPGAELFGAAFSGVLLASLVPRQWLIGVPTAEVPDAAVPTGSTQSFRIPAGHFATSLLAVGLVTWLISQTGVWAQEGASPESSPAITASQQVLPTTRFRILVPLGKDRQPSKNLPVVYVPRVLAKSLRAAAQPTNVAPTILLTSATYRVEVDKSRLTTVRAILDFQRLDQSDVLRLPLPFTDVNLGGASACLIGGRPFPVRRAVNGIGWEVEVLAQDLSAASPEAPITVELELLLARTRATSGQDILFGIPASGATQAVLNFDESTIDLSLPESKGEVVLSLNRQSATASLGQVTTVHFQWRTAEDAPPIPATITPRLLQAVSFSPLLTEVRFRVDVQIDSGSLTALSWQLPKGCYLRSLRSGADFRWHTTLNAEEKTRIDLNFLQPRHQTFLIEGTYLQPIDSAQAPRSCPPLEWLPTPNVRLVPGTIWAGFAAAPGFQLQPLIGQDVQNPIGRIEEFLTAWGLPAPQMRPEIVQQIKTDTETQFLLVPRIGERIFSQLHHSATIDRRRINWVSQAEVQIRDGSIFSYSLLVDRRLQIEQISVQDGGAERIFRWSSSRLNSLQNRVVIFLREPASQGQTITIRGNMPLRADLPTTFPSLRFEDTELIDGRLIVFAPKGVPVEFIPGRTLEPTDETNGFPETPTDLVNVGHYLLREPDLVASFEVLTPEKPGRIQTLVILEILQDRTVDVRGTSLLLKEDGPPSEVFVTVPQILAQAGIDFPDSQSQMVSEDQQQQTWRLQAQNFPEQAPRISWKTSGPYDSPEEWWQRPRFRNTDQEELYLALIPADASAPENLEAIDPASLPEEFRKLLQLSTDGQMAAVYRSEANKTPKWSELSPPETIDRSVSVERHTIWIDPNGRLQGTSKFLGLPLEASLSVAIPPEIEIHAVFVNDRALLPRRNSDGNLQIAGLSGTPSETATLIWSREIEPFERRGWGSAAETLPHLTLQTARSSTVAVIPPEGWQLWAPSGGKPVSWFETTVPSLRWWLEEARRASSADSRVTTDLFREYQTMLRDFPLETESGDLTASDLAAWNTFVAELNQTGFVQNTAISPSTTFYPRAEALAGHPEVWRAQFAAKSPMPPVRFWVFDTHRLMIYPAIVCGLLLFAGFTLMKGYDFGSWLAVSPTRSGWILGFLWWLCFSPSILGFALLALILAQEIRERATASTRGVMVG